MKYLMLTLIFVFWGFSELTAEEWPPKQEAGTETELTLPGDTYANKIYIPKDYTPGKRYPLIFFMHGSGGKPTTWPWKEATGGEGYIIIGVAYECMEDGGMSNKGIQTDNSHCLKMIKHLDRLRDYAHQTYGIDQEHVILSGLSMGGWAVDAWGICPQSQGRYRGYAILAAGPAPNGMYDSKCAKGLPVLVLNGAEDYNLESAQKGIPQLKADGAIVTQVVLDGEKHVPDTGKMKEPLKKWLDSIVEMDASKGLFNTVNWQYGFLTGTQTYEKDQDEKEWLTSFLMTQELVQKAPEGKPLLIYCQTQDSEKGKLSKQAEACLKFNEEILTLPNGVATAFAAENFTCLQFDISKRDEKNHPVIHRQRAPLLIMMDGQKKTVAILEASRSKDQDVCDFLKQALSDEQAALIDRRLEETKDVVKNLKGLFRKFEKAQKSIDKLLKKNSSKSTVKKLEKAQSEAAELQQSIATLIEGLKKQPEN